MNLTAIVAYFILPTLSGLLFGAVPALKDKGRRLDLDQARGALYGHDMTGRRWTQLLVAALLRVALPAALGVTRVLRSEVASR